MFNDAVSNVNEYKDFVHYGKVVHLSWVEQKE